MKAQSQKCSSVKRAQDIKDAGRGALKGKSQKEMAKADPEEIARCGVLMKEGLHLLGEEVTDEWCAGFLQVLLEMQSWNRVHNVTALQSLREMVTGHVIDSAAAAPFLSGTQIADAGTGGGFPGLVLAALRPYQHFTLIDSVSKKLAFVRSAQAMLKLQNLAVLHHRLEEISKAPPCFDCIVSRALAPLGRLCCLCLPYLTKDGVLVAMKGNLSDEEKAEVPSTAYIAEIKTLNVPWVEGTRSIVIIKPRTV